MKTEFYKMEYEAWDEGTDDLSLEQEAAYLRLCHQMYRRRGPVPNSLNTLFRIWRCHPNKAKAILGKLVDAGKIVITPDGHLSQSRVSRELVDRELRSSQAAVAGRLGGSQRAVNVAKSLKLNDTNEADASSQLKPSQPIRGEERIEEENREEEIETSDSENRGEVGASQPLAESAKAKRGTRLKEDWVPSEADIAFALGKGFSLADIEREATRFRNYWVSKAKNATKLSWARTWQNWMLDAPKAKPVPGAPVPFQMKAKPKARVMLDVATFDEKTWKRHIDGFLRDHTWDEEQLGPDPESRHCHIPKAVLDANGIRRPPITVNLNNGQKPQAWPTTPTPTVPDIEEFTQ